MIEQAMPVGLERVMLDEAIAIPTIDDRGDRMKILIISLSLCLVTFNAQAQCSIGWFLVETKIISATETFCAWEKSGVRMTRIVSTPYCPFNPC